MIPIAKPLIGEDEKKAVVQVLDSGMIACGPKVEEFEKKFAQFVGTKYAITTTSGTTALHLALLSIGITKGDEVIVPSFSFIATANVVLFCDAKPVFCDVHPRTFTIDPGKIEELITKKTKAIIPVHLYGQPADMKKILEVAENQSLSVIGDAAQAHGAKLNGNRIGSFGEVECFSFYPTKNMTTGEGGMITTNNDDIAERVYSLRNHGREKTKWGYEHHRLGYNYRMTDISAALGFVQLSKLTGFNQRRKKNAAFYYETLNNIQGIELPYVLPNVDHVYHQFTIKCNDRDTLIQHLIKNNIGYGIYYPKPLHWYHHLKCFGHNDLSESEHISKKVLSLPIHPALDQQDLETITSVISEVSQYPYK